MKKALLDIAGSKDARALSPGCQWPLEAGKKTRKEVPPMNLQMEHGPDDTLILAQ